MNEYKELRKNELKNLKQELELNYGFVPPINYKFYKLANERIWLLTPELEVFNTNGLRVETKGLYFCYFNSDRLRLSPEAAQLIGEEASKNVLMISDAQAEEIIRGFDIDVVTNLDADYIILKSSKGVLGVGKNHKTKVLCQFRKNRRIRKL